MSVAITVGAAYIAAVAYYCITSDPDANLEGRAAAILLRGAVIMCSIAIGLVPTYANLVKMRQQEALLREASAICKTVEGVCTSICEMELGEMKEYEATIIDAYRQLEADIASIEQALP